MNDKLENLLFGLEAFVTERIVFDEGEPKSHALARRLDVLGRVVELLRLKTGEFRNRASMNALLEMGLGVTRDIYGQPSIRVGGMGGSCADLQEERTEPELQLPLLLFLLRDYRNPRCISETLTEFVRSISMHLSARDVETTATGVTRVMTTTRGAARTLHEYALLSSGDGVNHRRWELTVLGVLVGAALHRQGQTMDMPRRLLKTNSAGRFGSEGLAKEVAKMLHEFENPEVVSAELSRLCAPNSDVFPSFNHVVTLVCDFSRSLPTEPLANGARERKDAARQLIAALVKAIPAEALRNDFAKEFAIVDLLGPLA